MSHKNLLELLRIFYLFLNLWIFVNRAINALEEDKIENELNQKICEIENNYTVNLKNINDLKNCNIIKGDVNIYGFDGNLDDLEVFSTVKRISGVLKIIYTNKYITNLSFLRNLEVIDEKLVIFNTQLISLGLTSLKRIEDGLVFISENSQLCYINSLSWLNYINGHFPRSTEIVQQSIVIENNKNDEDCKVKCDKACSCGCWGPGPTQCQSCEDLRYKNDCIEKCDDRFNRYGPNNFSLCQELCVKCTGPTFENCKCKYVQDGISCKRKCPSWKYNDLGICKECHENCLDGCTGPLNKIGEGGCNNCGKLGIYFNGTTYCLGENEKCPESVVQKTIYLQFQRILKNICVPSGVYRFKIDEIFGYTCVSSHYEYRPIFRAKIDRDIMICKPCFSECHSCHGPGPNQCNRCRNYRIYQYNGNETDDGKTQPLNCSSTCPVGNLKKKYRYPPYNRIETHCYSVAVKRAIPWAEILLYSTFIVGILIILVFILYKYQIFKKAKGEEIRQTFPILPDGNIVDTSIHHYEHLKPKARFPSANIPGSTGECRLPPEEPWMSSSSMTSYHIRRWQIIPQVYR